ncbi:MFS transporter [Frigidibacter sp. RF13]|uniref:MFS transporter n=1 Tax=Frigidibacter sp. RF13 TaxID=2997340 RepID=UPI00226EA4A2|nr:MFS transporter [Frigidibacter sp. RF13]MCY1127828.1 MFS transporter [Frigidibacter sp. RF13]
MDAAAKKRIWGWWFFDWASQPYNTLLLTFVFGPYFAEVARAHFGAQGMDAEAAGAAAQAYWGWGQSISGVIIALLAPILGAIADGSGKRMIWIWIFSILYVAGSWGLWYLLPGASDLHWALIWFGLGLIGMEFATIFTNSLMPDLTGDEDMGKISGSGFAFGYLGGIIALVIMLLFFAENAATGKTLIGADPLFGLDASAREGTRAVGPITAIWYVIFMVPFFLWVREPKGPARRVNLGAAMRDLWRLIKSLKERTSLGAHLLSSMFYRDALNALYAFGGVYASGVLGWSVIKIGIFGIVGAVAAAIFSWVGGKMDSARGPKPVINLSMYVLIAVCLVIAGMSREAFYGVPFAEGSPWPDYIFYACGCLIGAAGGALQSSSRTMMVFHTTQERATESFGLYALSGKCTAFIAPFSIALFTTISGSQRIGIAIPLIALFLVGMVILRWVKPMGERTP